MLKQVVVDGPRPYPPRVSEFSKPFWDALSAGSFASTQCRRCHRLTFPPKLVCPECWSDQVAWTPMPRVGFIYSWTRVYAAPAVFRTEAPYFLCIADLEDRVRLACRLLAENPRDVRIGAPIEMVSMRFDDGPLFAAQIQTTDNARPEPGEARMPALQAILNRSST